MQKLKSKPNSVDEYFASLQPEQKVALQELRELIRAAAPGSAEAISYAMPAFKLNGRGLVCYAAFNNHYSFFPMHADLIKNFAKELEGYVTAKGTIQIRYGKPLPRQVIRKLVTLRVREIQSNPRK